MAFGVGGTYVLEPRGSDRGNPRTTMTLASLEAMTWSIVTGAVTAVLWLAASPPGAFDATTLHAANGPEARDPPAATSTRTAQSVSLMPRVTAHDPAAR